MRLVALAITRTDNLLSPLFEGSLPPAGGVKKRRFCELLPYINMIALCPLAHVQKMSRFFSPADALGSPHAAGSRGRKGPISTSK
jgi:hypothetical protein